VKRDAEIALAAGLDPGGPTRNHVPAQRLFEHDGTRAWDRQTGHTTGLICRALAAAETGESCVIVVPGYAMADATRRELAKVADRWGEPFGCLSVVGRAHDLREWIAEQTRGKPGKRMRVFFDRTWHEHADLQERIQAVSLEVSVRIANQAIPR